MDLEVVSQNTYTVLIIGPPNIGFKDEVAQLAQAGHIVATKNYALDVLIASHELNKEYLDQFDVIILFGDTYLFGEAARLFKGPIIFRFNGGRDSISSILWHLSARGVIESRRNISILLPTDAHLAREEPWISDRSVVVPIALSGFSTEDGSGWQGMSTKSQLVLLTVPSKGKFRRNVDEWHRVFKYISTEFAGTEFAVVTEGAEDLPVIGANRTFLQSRGIIDLSGTKEECHAAAVRMLLLGGPVGYFSGSFLAQIIGISGPGEVQTTAQAKALAKRLRAGDQVLIDEMIAAQADTIAYFDPSAARSTLAQAIDNILVGLGPIISRPTEIPKQGIGESLAWQFSKLLTDAIRGNVKDDARLRASTIRGAYNTLLGRDPDDGGFISFSELLAGGETVTTFLRELIISEEGRQFAGRNPMTRFVRVGE